MVPPSVFKNATISFLISSTNCSLSSITLDSQYIAQSSWVILQLYCIIFDPLNQFIWSLFCVESFVSNRYSLWNPIICFVVELQVRSTTWIHFCPPTL